MITMSRIEYNFLRCMTLNFHRFTKKVICLQHMRQKVVFFFATLTRRKSSSDRKMNQESAANVTFPRFRVFVFLQNVLFLSKILA